MLDRSYVRERLYYNVLTGQLTWKKHSSRNSQWNSRWAGKQAGYLRVKENGYRRKHVRLDGKLYTASHVIWLYMLGYWPEYEIDHINHDGTDNRWINLREVTHAENMQNTSKSRSNTSGVVGVHWVKRDKKWSAFISCNKKRVHGGYFDDFEEACSRRKQLENEYGFNENHGT